MSKINIQELIINNNLNSAMYECDSSSGGKYYEIVYDKKGKNYKINYGSKSAYKSGLTKAVYDRSTTLDKIKEKIKKGYVLIHHSELSETNPEKKEKVEKKKKEISVEECINSLFD